jgi:methionine synthase II (cobalamin-independent)
MDHAYNCIATGIGSLPLTDVNEAVALPLRYLPEAPIWPQLPLRKHTERFCEMYSEAIPGLQVDTAKERYWFDTSKDLTPELEKFFERFLANDLEFFKISEDHAAGLYAFVRELKAKGLPKGARFLKGHLTGPFTFATTLKDEQGRDIAYNEVIFDAITKGLAMKAAWQIGLLKQFGLPVIIFIDDPAIGSLGSAFSAVSAEDVSSKLNEIIDVIHAHGGIAGSHCCGNADWPIFFRSNVDIVNFDAYGFVDKVLLYPDDIKRFFGRGGALAWGIVPTGDFTGNETAAGLLAKLEDGIGRLAAQGIDRKTILRQALITPSCGMGSLTPDKALAILKLTREIADAMQKKV